MCSIQVNPKRTLTISLHEIQRFSGTIHEEILPFWKCIQRNIMSWHNACIWPAHRKGWFTKLFIGIVPNRTERWEMVPQNFLPHVQLLLSTEKRITTREDDKIVPLPQFKIVIPQDWKTEANTGQQKRVLWYHIAATREKSIMQRAISHCSGTNCHDRTIATVCRRKERWNMGQCNATSHVKYEKCQAH